MTLFTNTDKKQQSAVNELCWELLEQFQNGDMSQVAKTLLAIDAKALPSVFEAVEMDYERRFMNGLVTPFGALKTDLLVSLWHLTKQTEKIEALFRSISSEDEELVDHYYPAQMIKLLQGQNVKSDYFSTIDRLHPDLSQSLENTLENDAPFKDDFKNVFQRSEAFFLSYNGNILFDVLALIEHIHAGAEAFQEVASSAKRFREGVISGKFKQLNGEAKLGTLAFLLPVYPKIFESQSSVVSSLSDPATRLYNKAIDIAVQ